MKTYHTQFPNEILEAMPDMNEAEMKLTAVLVRLTYGYHTNEVKLTYNDMQAKTGLSRGGVANAITAVCQRGFFSRGNKSMWYANSLLSRPNTTQQTEETVYPVDQNSTHSRLKSIDQSLPSRPNTRLSKEKEEKERKERKEEESPPTPLVEPELQTAWEEICELIDIFTQASGKRPPPRRTEEQQAKFRERWVEPIWAMRQRENGRTGEQIKTAVQECYRRDLVVASPASIESVFFSLLGRANGHNPPPEEAAAERAARIMAKVKGGGA